jgi:hypothetical protein
MADLMKFVKDEFVTKKDFPALSWWYYHCVLRIKEGEKLEHSFSKELLSKEEVLVTQKLLLFVKCQVL